MVQDTSPPYVTGAKAIRHALYINSLPELEAALGKSSQLPPGVELFIHDFPNDFRYLPNARIGGGADALTMEPFAAALRDYAHELIPSISPIFRWNTVFSDHSLSDNALVTLLIDRVNSPLRRAIKLWQLCSEAQIQALRIGDSVVISPAILRFLQAKGLPVLRADGSDIRLAERRFKPPVSFVELPRPRLGLALTASMSAADIFVTAPHSELYLLNVLPVIRHTSAIRPSLLLLGARPGAIAQFHLGGNQARVL